MAEDSFRPRINHVAISVDAALMDTEGRATLLDFFADVFGWTEGDNTGETGNPLILYTGAPLQFAYLLPGHPYLAAPHLDHFGISVATEDELDDMLARARRYQEHDDRVDIVDKKVEDHGMLAITSFYVRYLLPMMVEVQWWDFKELTPPGA